MSSMRDLFKHLVVILLTLVVSFLTSSAYAPNSDSDERIFPSVGASQFSSLVVPSIVHQIYDYQSPNFFLYLSLICVQRYIKPDKHILWVNDEGRYRKGQWQGWQHKAISSFANDKIRTWEYDLAQLIQNGKMEVKFLTFPFHPPGNTSTFAPNKAHRSDFVRLHALTTIGGIYLDTDAFAIHNMDELRQHNFTMSFDNIVNPDKTAPKRLNNGVMLAAPHSMFLLLWAKKYAAFNPESFDFDSSVVPYNLMTQFPDLIHLEMSRIAPMSFAFQTARIAEAITCGIYVPPVPKSSTQGERRGAIWAPNCDGRAYSYEGTRPDEYMYSAMEKKMVLHLTMSQARGYSMMRKALGGPADLARMPSLLGRIFRIALFGKDEFDYRPLYAASVEAKNAAWKSCRDGLGMHAVPDRDVSSVDSGSSRQQYVHSTQSLYG